MNNYTISNGVETYTRISKAAARKAYNSGSPVFICPVKCNPANKYWQTGIEIDNAAGDPDKSFDKVVNSFEFFNCGYNELGRYAAFYKISF